MEICEACGKAEGQHHVTVRVTTFNPSGSTVIRVVQFWVCDLCHKALQQTTARDDRLRMRMARRLTDFPSYLSRWRDWRGRKYQDMEQQ